MLHHALEDTGYVIKEAIDGARALAIFEQLQPDIVLLDILMPGMNGIETCARLRALPGGGRTPVLIITVLDDLESVEQAFEAGATDYITKPLRLDVLRHRVRVLLRASQAEKALRESKARLERSHQALTDRVATLETLHRIGVAMSSRLIVDALLQFIVEQAAVLVNTDSCSILLLDEATDELVFHAAGSHQLTGTRFPASKGIAARVLREGVPQIIHNVATDPDHYTKRGGPGKS